MKDKRYLLHEGMCFKNSSEVKNILGYGKKDRREIALGELKHYCDYTINEDKTITINKIYDSVIPFKSNEFKYNIGDLIDTKFGTIKILDLYRKQWDEDKDNRKVKTCLCECMNDGYIFELREHHISQGVGCPICGNRKLIKGLNSVYDVRKDLLKYFVNIEDAKNVTTGSTKKVLLKCPECGIEKEMHISNLVRTGFHCEVCNDNISYPNKFVRNFLKQLNIYFIPEKSFNWSDGKIYDQYLPDFNAIIENHGKQHYEDVKAFNSAVVDQNKNDIYKKNIALDNGIKFYIELDCRESNFEYIKKSIMSSILPDILNFSENDIDWKYCDECSRKTIIKEICLKWNDHKNITMISEEYNMDKHTISNYLEIGSNIGWCNYKKNNLEGMSIATREKNTKPIYCVDLNIYFKDRFLCENYFLSNGFDKFDGRSLYNKINKKIKYKGYMFEYITKKRI